MSSIPVHPASPAQLLDGLLQRRQRTLASPKWILLLLAVQIAAQLGLLALGDTPLRVICRIAVFGVSAGLLFVIPRRGRGHPATVFGWVVVAIVPLGLLHPESNTLKAGLAQIAMYVAILAPLIWVAGVYMDERWFRRIVLIIWGFAVASAAVGALQTRFPWLQPEVSMVIREQAGGAYLEGMRIQLADGSKVFRPMGLTDMPGGAAGAGMIAIVLGCGILLTERRWLLRIAAFVGMGVGIYCILLSQVRSILIMTGVSVLSVLALLYLARLFVPAMRLAIAAAIAVSVGTVAGVAIGGTETLSRLQTLVAEDPTAVYYSNRGHFLHRTLVLDVPQYPFGAGLGRWGMMNNYFGTAEGTLWAEIQWTAWVYDGGVPLVIAYVLAMLAVFVVCWRIVLSRASERLSLWAAVLFGYAVSVLAVTFNYPIFISEGGITFWLLNAALFGAWQTERLRARRAALAALPSAAPGVQAEAAR